MNPPQSTPEFTSYHPPGVAPPVGHYSHALEVPPGHRLLYISGQVPERADGAVPEGFEAQCHAAWDNVLAVLGAAGMTTANLVKVTTYLTDRDQAEPNSRIRQERLGRVAPALTVMVATTLSSAWLLEIEAIAAGPSGE
jgi:enamine deaminase RidA (YjgF/YER057c/UK114 family)